MNLPGQFDWDRRHLPFNLVTNIDAASKNAHGWTYILLSGDKKTMKIGHTIRSVYDRVFCLRSEPIYRSLDLGFLLAIEGKSYEKILHSYFQDYRAVYRWIDETGEIIECNWQEHGKLDRSDRAVRFQKTTSLELFHIPPRKIGKRLIEIVTRGMTDKQYYLLNYQGGYRTNPGRFIRLYLASHHR